jgi:enolase
MSGLVILTIQGREILDSRGNPTLEVELLCQGGIKTIASVPSGASVGAFEAFDLRDGDPKRYHGLGLLKSIALLENEISRALVDKSFSSIKELDQALIELDGTVNKGVLGANTSLALSIAFAKALAKSENLALYQIIKRENPVNFNVKNPIPLLNLINGGKHSDNGLAIQEFLLVPPEKISFKEKIRLAAEFFYDLKNRLQKLGERISVGDEGGFAPNFSKSHEALNHLVSLIEKSKYQDCKLALDAAASSFYEKNIYQIDGEKFNSSELISYYKDLIKNYPIISIEDPLAEEDFFGWERITEELQNQILLVGDDLFVTNQYYLAGGIEKGLANAILIKPNQVGTLSETLATVVLAKENDYEVIASHRSGETEEKALAHLALGIGAKYLKAGAPCRSERLAKYNELIRLDLET